MKKFTSQDLINLRELLTTASNYLDNAQVNQNELASDLRKVRDHLALQRGRSLSRVDYREIAPFIQTVADALSNPQIARIPFALPSTAIASRLREVIAELKKYTRLK